jgi:hypothetical protein
LALISEAPVLLKMETKKIKPNTVNLFVVRNMKALEMIGVIMRIISFSIVSWLGSKSPFLLVWGFNTVDAILLSWCAILKKDFAYTLLNCFWVLVGLVGVLRALHLI